MTFDQIAKKNWLKECDHNSKLFHVVNNTQRNKASISTMKLKDGSVLASLEEIHEVAVRYFQQFFIDQTDR